MSATAYLFSVSFFCNTCNVFSDFKISFRDTKCYLQQQKEGDSKRQNKQRENNRKFNKGAQHIHKHDHVDPETRKFANEKHQIEPGKKHAHAAQIPLPPLRNNSATQEQCNETKSQSIGFAHITDTRRLLAIVDVQYGHKGKRVNDPLHRIFQIKVVASG